MALASARTLACELASLANRLAARAALARPSQLPRADLFPVSPSGDG
ncbi:hypothetical protein XOC_3594 [Xanthomonas oryzae pv. oryzicola BLS256]|uniref:Uncharacterized protein n=1 Tax=Xanthomonas oryzae pv. oryzicola (strain BLS256) TaxID=383407 RepID=G7TEX9_XANOB|nr:hypothetical protein XOC_3594 [Xanthomonas oryzae pv. oryzicola BLS256]QEO96159.1 hypothetical protein XOCgx_1165 [Xanthomonas oryzae pv. oryzicola]